MLHPFMTTELVRQRRAALDGEAHNRESSANSISELTPIPSPASSPQQRGRWHATSAPWWPAPPEPRDYGGRHDHPPRAQ
jgi:hypothetical protein